MLKKKVKMTAVSPESTAKGNTSVSLKHRDGSIEAVTKGRPLEHTVKHEVHPDLPPQVIGVNFGVTLNMDNYESARIDCWLTDTVREGETTEEAFSRLKEVVMNQVQETSQNLDK